LGDVTELGLALFVPHHPRLTSQVITVTVEGIFEGSFVKKFAYVNTA
jgi:hypothetical protein